MKVAGLSSRMRAVPIRPSVVHPRNCFFHRPTPWTSAIVSTAMKPTLCRCSAYCAPGLPRSTQSCIDRRLFLVEYDGADAVVKRLHMLEARPEGIVPQVFRQLGKCLACRGDIGGELV